MVMECGGEQLGMTWHDALVLGAWAVIVYVCWWRQND